MLRKQKLWISSWILYLSSSHLPLLLILFFFLKFPLLSLCLSFQVSLLCLLFFLLHIIIIINTVDFNSALTICQKLPFSICTTFLNQSTKMQLIEQHTFFSIYFNWRIIALQYCNGVCHTSAWISHKYTCVCPSWASPPISLPTLSLWVVPEHWLWGLFFIHWTCMTIKLVICFTYGIVHVSVLFSQIIPPSLSPTKYKILFFASVSSLLSCT